MRAMVSCVYLLPVLALCACSSSKQDEGPSQITCATDFNCPIGWSCDPATSVCKEGTGPDNRIRGTLRCAYDKAENVDGNNDLGASYLAAMINGQAIEISHAVKCVIDGSRVLVNATGADREGASIAFQLSIASKDVVAGGAHEVAGHYVTPKEVKFPWGFVAREGNPANTVLGIFTEGTVTLDHAGVVAGETLGLDIDIGIQVPREAPKDCIATCTTQADCGPGFFADGTMSHPVCLENSVGGPRQCRIYCDEGLSDPHCAAIGGLCDWNYFCGALPRCDDSTKTMCAQLPQTYPACPDCCNERTGGGQEYLYGELLYRRCGCASDAPCKSQCEKYCTGDVYGFDACLDCVFDSAESKACMDAAFDDCDANESCKAYRTCLNDCP